MKLIIANLILTLTLTPLIVVGVNECIYGKMNQIAAANALSDMNDRIDVLEISAGEMYLRTDLLAKMLRPLLKTYKSADPVR
jgi:hypothetical protein